MKSKVTARSIITAANDSDRTRKINLVFYPASILFLFVAAYVYGSLNELWTRSWDIWAIVYLIKTIIEIIATGFALFYVLVALTYTRPVPLLASAAANRRHPNIGIAYLCCGDIDREALTLRRLGVLAAERDGLPSAAE